LHTNQKIENYIFFDKVQDKITSVTDFENIKKLLKDKNKPLKSLYLYKPKQSDEKILIISATVEFTFAKIKYHDNYFEISSVNWFYNSESMKKGEYVKIDRANMSIIIDTAVMEKFKCNMLRYFHEDYEKFQKRCGERNTIYNKQLSNVRPEAGNQQNEWWVISEKSPLHYKALSKEAKKLT
jgi:hypothetical protein